MDFMTTAYASVRVRFKDRRNSALFRVKVGNPYSKEGWKLFQPIYDIISLRRFII